MRALHLQYHEGSYTPTKGGDLFAQTAEKRFVWDMNHFAPIPSRQYMMARMKPSIEVGNTESISFDVTEAMQPQFHGRVIHPVCSTWDIAHQFECAARKILEPHLEEDEQGIGSHLSIDHLALAPLGKRVTVTATITELNERKVVCSITASIGDVVCATGKQIQRVLPKSTLETLIHNATST